jgi:hypothetical protein
MREAQANSLRYKMADAQIHGEQIRCRVRKLTACATEEEESCDG